MLLAKLNFAQKLLQNNAHWNGSSGRSRKQWRESVLLLARRFSLCEKRRRRLFVKPLPPGRVLLVLILLLRLLIRLRLVRLPRRAPPLLRPRVEVMVRARLGRRALEDSVRRLGRKALRRVPRPLLRLLRFPLILLPLPLRLPGSRKRTN